MAKVLGLNFVFVCEFEELASPIRTPETQGGGVHGNGILTRFDFASIGRLVHHVQPVNWERDGLAVYHEPRHGQRVTLFVDIASPLGVLRVYSAHLETFGGGSGRAGEFAEIYQHLCATYRFDMLASIPDHYFPL